MAKLLRAQLGEGFDPVHDRHLPVHQHEVVGKGLGVSLLHHAQALRTVPGHIHLQTESACHGGEDFTRRCVVIHHQQPQAQQFFCTEHAPGLRVVLNTKTGVEMEG